MALSLVLHWTASISSVYLSSCPARLAACGPVTRPCLCYRCAACRRWRDGCRSFSVERSRKCCISWPGDWRVNWWRGVEQNQGSTHTLPYCSWSTHTTCATGENEWQRRPPPPLSPDTFNSWLLCSFKYCWMWQVLLITARTTSFVFV